MFCANGYSLFRIYSSLIAHGCSLYENSLGITMLQFNCYLAFILVLVMGLYFVPDPVACLNLCVCVCFFFFLFKKLFLIFFGFFE